MNIYYVYFYLRSDFTPYYVGKGKGNRYKEHHRSVSVPRDESKIIFVKQNLTELQAFILERYYIRWFGRKNNDTGILRNLTDGGEGCSGWIPTTENKDNISKGKKNKKIKPFSKAHKQNISNALKGNTNGIGYILTEEQRNKISLKKLGKPRSQETKDKISKTKTGKSSPQQRVVCPHCGLLGGLNGMKHYHFDNCKYKK